MKSIVWLTTTTFEVVKTITTRHFELFELFDMYLMVFSLDLFHFFSNLVIVLSITSLISITSSLLCPIVSEVLELLISRDKIEILSISVSV